MDSFSIFDFDDTKDSNIKDEIFNILMNNFFNLLKNILKYILTDLFLYLCNFRYSSWIKFNSWK
jgi:hypothetical protein